MEYEDNKIMLKFNTPVTEKLALKQVHLHHPRHVYELFTNSQYIDSILIGSA